mmetsp:Transcript_44033/g.70513  ORF Transcript_44033/g.70513 Transcript_44033/m.70513 type:complete len:95 (-) Transcript_44033:650-934(-)
MASVDPAHTILLLTDPTLELVGLGPLYYLKTFACPATHNDEHCVCSRHRDKPPTLINLETENTAGQSIKRPVWIVNDEDILLGCFDLSTWTRRF